MYLVGLDFHQVGKSSFFYSKTERMCGVLGGDNWFDFPKYRVSNNQWIGM